MVISRHTQITVNRLIIYFFNSGIKLIIYLCLFACLGFLYNGTSLGLFQYNVVNVQLIIKSVRLRQCLCCERKCEYLNLFMFENNRQLDQ